MKSGLYKNSQEFLRVFKCLGCGQSPRHDIRLKDLNIEELLYILNNRFGDDIILLCHEPIDAFCHRRLIADYIEIKTGIYIPEVSVDENGNVKKLLPIRYKNRLKEVMK